MQLFWLSFMPCHSILGTNSGCPPDPDKKQPIPSTGRIVLFSPSATPVQKKKQHKKTRTSDLAAAIGRTMEDDPWAALDEAESEEAQGSVYWV